MLETNNKFQVKRVRDTDQCVDGGLVPTAFNAGDLRIAGADPHGEFLLSQAMVHSVFDEEPGDFAKPSTRFQLSPISRATDGTPHSRTRGRGAYRTDRLRMLSGLQLVHEPNLSHMIKEWI